MTAMPHGAAGLASTSAGPSSAPRATRMFRAAMISYSSFVCLFLSSVIASRLLGVEGKGTFSLCMATVTGLTIVATLGVPQGQMYHASKQQQWLRHFMANAIPFSILTGGVVTLVYFLGGRGLGLRQVTTLGWAGFLTSVIAVPAGVLLMYQRQYFLTLHRFELAKAAGAVSATLPLLGYLGLYAAGHTEVSAFMGAFAASQLLCFVIFLMPARRVGPVQGHFSMELARRSLAFGARQYASDIASYLMSRLDFFIVALYLGARGLGIYSVAAGLAEIIIRLSNEIGTMLYPVFARGDLKPGQPAAALRIVTLMAVVLATGLALISGPLIRILYGTAFADAIPPFRWLLLGTVAWSTTHVTWTYVSSSGRPGVGVLVFSVAAGVDVLLNVILLPGLGVVGASIAATASYIAAGLVFFHLFRGAERCSIRTALVPKWSDLQVLWRAFAEAQAALLRVLRRRPSPVAAPW
jgi:O-antigen/teichoic acid export membrane protein